jgi:cyclopropane fatty-acyl-phospholipid synthase-like methyltransferase
MKRLAPLAQRIVGRLVLLLRSSRRVRMLWDELHNLYYFADFTTHDAMLADASRVDRYHAALTKHVRPGDEVIDLGTGTGILACYAARAGARRVHAVVYGKIIVVY